VFIGFTDSRTPFRQFSRRQASPLLKTPIVVTGTVLRHPIVARSTTDSCSGTAIFLPPPFRRQFNRRIRRTEISACLKPINELLALFKSRLSGVDSGEDAFWLIENLRYTVSPSLKSFLDAHVSHGASPPEFTIDDSKPLTGTVPLPIRQQEYHSARSHLEQEAPSSTCC
jgi:hypothetical protein